MAVGEIYRLAVKWEHEITGDDAVNIFHFKQLDALILDTPGEDLVGAFQEEVEELYAGIVSVNYSIVQYSVRKVASNEDAYDAPAAVTGERGTTSDQLPSTVAAIITWTTGLTGRNNRGRTYLPPTSEGDLLAGLWASTYFPTGMGNFADAMIEAMAELTVTHAGWQLGVRSETFDAFQPITGYVLRQVPGTVRRRRFGVGS